MPKVDMDMAEGTIAKWHVSEGEKVARGDPLFDIETDKAAMEVEAPGEGTLHHVLAGEGDTVAIGSAVAFLYSEGEEVGDPPAGAKPAMGSEEPTGRRGETRSDTQPVQEEPAAPPDEKRKIEAGPRATPLARRLAREADLRLSDIPGTGPRGRIQGEDVREAVRATDMRASPDPEPKGRAGAQTGPPLVLIHGFLSDAQSWGPLEKAFGSGRPIHKLELPGHGRATRKPPADFSALVSHMRRGLDELNLEAMHLVGHSLGGAVALALADTRPRRVASLTLIAPAGLGPQIDGAALDGMLRATRAESLAPWLKRLVADPDRISWNYVQAVLAGRSDEDLRDAQRRMAETLFADGTQCFDLQAALGRVEMPTRIIWGRRDGIIPWSHALSAPGRVSLNLFDDLGHMPQIEAPEAVADLLAASVGLAP
ncbi:acetoin dehydrogenase dihydrolipoyllysine-residue acetyltransferase subunit [Jannaschia aquimarina]|uniref:AcoC_1 protein n=2 Tax=Jannaschia aquimarina TaxID=935700 RepID=A0A0D1DBT5_9RHOB|nr:acetoin dehydrogenase dihydrolipoyllysine-residue acetyltransferase subunit [Jannaschia aquimarina]KIT17453.1 Dihydrolipoyllysine-residue acetyltransferase component of acetoin cleaving system [Jannaschia aquimarina]SNS75705.1 pyruvate dehydrogenase E2 component (dihydrolipoamide acetyltransferase) [Jannaschia aquimarina]